MKKMNKKGFTLIEMLVVIAIIAVLVAIIIPTVSNATEKANAAANAANLRSMLAEASIDYLGAADDDTGLVKFTAGETPTFAARDGAPKAKPVKALSVTKDAKFEITVVDGTITAKLGGKTIDDFATVAETGKAPKA